MKSFQDIKALSMQRKIYLIILIIIASYTIFGFLIAPPVLKWVLAKKLTEQLKREVDIEKIRINPYKLSTQVSGFVMKNRENRERFLSFNELYINLQISSLFKKGVIIEEMKMDAPYLNIVRHKDSSYNFSDIIEVDKRGAGPSPEQSPIRFSINNIQISNGGIDFLDGPKDTQHTVRNLKITIPMISNFPYFLDSFVQPSFEAEVNGNTVSLTGKSKPFHDSLETVIDLNITDLDITHYLAYLPYRLNFGVLSGKISFNNRVSFTQYINGRSSLSLWGDIYINDICTVDGDGNPLVNLPRVTLSVEPSRLMPTEIHLSRVLFESPEVHLRRDKSGGLNIMNLFPMDEERMSGDQNEQSNETVSIEADGLRISDGKFLFSDASFEKPVRNAVEKIEITGEDISNEETSTGRVSLSLEVNNKGTVSASGDLGINPVSADLELDIKDIDIVPLQSYITERTKILVTGGRFSADGNIALGRADDQVLNIIFKGKTSLSEFSSVDKINADDFLKWNSLYLSGINFESSPFTVIIDEVALSDFYSRLIINADGSLNVQGIIEDKKDRTDNAPEGESPAAEEPDAEIGAVAEENGPQKLIKISTVTLQAGTINFSDRHIKPTYSADLLEIGGRISGLSSEEDAMADVNLRGSLENYAPLEITGKINPLSKDLFVDLKTDFTDMDLSPLTPYANRYMGYTIQKGKLSLELQYLIAKKKLDSKNNIYLDQFTLGERVDSPDATKLPVKLAISLLKNRKGEISLNLPVSGKIDDPDFRLGRIILKMVVNILVKAATSPFGILGAIVGGGEELSYLQFDYGSFSINDAAAAKLDKLVRALSERPNLNMDIKGFVDVEKDREGLRQYTFNKKLKAAKLKDTVEQGGEASAVDEIVVSPDEYEIYLEKAYEKETFPKPRNALGMTKKLPAPEMEKLILTYIEITDDDLRQLASERSLRVKDYILKSGQVDQKRIFLAEPESLQPEEKEKLRSSRVEFSLK